MTESELSFEEARDALVDVVARLEGGGLTLEESLALWERGESLAATCQAWLDRARVRVEGGTPSGAQSAGAEEPGS